jgi:hypothetical protein
MNRLLFIGLVASSLAAANDDLLPENFLPPSTSQKFFETCKKRLHPELREFVDDFSVWPPEDKQMVIVFTWHITTDGLSAERRASHQDGFWHWMACDNGRSIWKYRLGVCLDYLKHQN